MTKVVVATRPQSYVNFKTDPETFERVRIDSVGTEIVKEISVSEEGLRVLADRVDS
jgi:hypothetical protein